MKIPTVAVFHFAAGLRSDAIDIEPIRRTDGRIESLELSSVSADLSTARASSTLGSGIDRFARGSLLDVRKRSRRRISH